MTQDSRISHRRWYNRGAGVGQGLRVSSGVVMVSLALLLIGFVTVPHSPEGDRIPGLTRSHSSKEIVQRAWQLAQEAGTYHFATQIAQTTYPAPTLVNVGRSSETTKVYIDGQTDLAERAMHMSLWSDGGSVLNPRDGVEIRIEGDQAFGRQIGGLWEPVDDFSDAFAPGSDLMAYLAGARDIEDQGTETRQVGEIDIQFTRYAFALDGPAFAEYLRTQLERYLKEKGELPLGLVLDSSDAYRAVTGQGEVWIDSRGLPLRLAVHLVYPRQKNGERVAADIQTDFSGFAPAAGASTASTPTGLARVLGSITVASQRLLRTPQAQQQAARQAAFLAGVVAFLCVLWSNRRSRTVHAALAVTLIVSLVLTPLLTDQQVYAFFQRQEARQAEYEQSQQEQQAAREAEEEWASRQWDPNLDPLAGDLEPAIVDVPRLPVQGARASAALQAASSVTSTVTILSACDDQDDPDKDEDPDQDGLTNCQETDYGTDQNNRDTDGDGLWDGWEVLRLGTDPQAQVGQDSDGDGIRDDLEVIGFEYSNKTWYSNPIDPDTDQDGIVDSVECPERKTSSPLPAATTRCRDTDVDGVPDLFDRDSDGDGVPDRIDLSPFTALNQTSPFTRETPFELIVNDLDHKPNQPNAYYPVLVDFQLRPSEAARLTYALNVLDWPSGDEKGQIQRKLGNDSTFADYMTTQELEANPNAANGDMRLIPMLEIEMSGSNLPLPLTTPETSVQIRGEEFSSPNSVYQRWVSATVGLKQVGSNIRLDFQLQDLSLLDRAAVYAGTCAKGGAVMHEFADVPDGGQRTLSSHKLVDVADGEHFLMLYSGDRSVCADIGDIPNGSHTNLMIDQEPFEPYGVSVRDKTKTGTVLAYVPVNIVPDETGGGRVAFSAHMLYLPTAGSLGDHAQKVRLVWLVQMLTDYCKPEPEDWRAYHPLTTDRWCDQAYAWDLDNTQIVHTYDDDWFLTGLVVREDHGLDVSIVWEDPLAKPADERQFDGWLWILARGLEETFTSGRDQNSNNRRDIGVVTTKYGIQVADSTIAGRFDEDTISSGTTITQRLGIPLTATMHVNNLAYPNQDSLAQIMMNETVSILNDHFDPVLDTPTLLFAREERYRFASLDMVDYRTIDDGALTMSLGTGTSRRPEETLASMSWAPYRYDEGRWRSFPLQEYWDRMEVEFQALFPGDPDLPQEDREDIALGQIAIAKSFYLSMFQGRVGVVRVGTALTYQFDANQTDGNITTSVGNWIKTGGKQISGIVTSIVAHAIKSYEVVKMVDEVMASVFKSYTPLTKSQMLTKAIGMGIKGMITDKLKLDTLKKLFGKLITKGEKAAGAAFGIAMAVAAVAVVTLTIIGYLLKNKVAAYVVGIAGKTISAVMAVASTIKTIYQFVKGTLEPLSKAAMVAGVVGVIIAGVVAFAAFLANVIVAGVQFGSITFNSMLAGVIASTITAAIMFAITLIPVVGQIIAAIIAVIDALIFAICAAVPAEKLSEGKVGQWFCKGISGLVSEAIKWAIYGATIMVDFEDENRLQFGEIDHRFVYLEKGVSEGNEIEYSAILTNTIDLVNVPIDWKAATYAWQYTIDGDDHLQSSHFEYVWQADDVDIHQDLDRGAMDPAWQSDSGTHPFYVVPTAASNGMVLERAGINQQPSLYLSEGYAVPAQECLAIPAPWFLPPPVPFVNLFPECHIRTERATNHIEFGEYFIFDVFPSTLDGFYVASAQDGGYSLAWSQDQDLSFPVQVDFDGDGLRSPAFGGSDPDDTKWDYDGDGLSDPYEFQNGSRPDLFDTDADGLDDGAEVRLGTDPTRKDTDGDGLTDREETDGWEIVYAFDPDGLQLRTRVTSDPLSVDADADTLTDFREKVFGFNPHVTSDPNVLALQTEVYEAAAPSLLLRFEEDVGAETFADTSGYGNLGACAGVGCPVSVDGRYGYGLQFGGAQWLDSTDFDIGDDFTLALWVNPQNTNNGQAFIGKHAANGYNYLLFGLYEGGYHFRIRGATYTAGTKTTGWQHLAVVGQKSGSSTQVSVYKDGSLLWQQTLNAVVGQVSGKPWTIGQDWDSGTSKSDFFRGQMDEVIVLDRALSLSEVQALSAGRYNPADLFVRPGDTLDYAATATNKLYDRYAQGLLSLETTSPAAFSQFDVPPEPFVLIPLEQRQVASGTMQIASTAASQAVTLTQVASALVTDQREQSDFAEMWLPLNDPSTATLFQDESGAMPPRDGECSATDNSCPTREEEGYFDYAVRFDGSNDRIVLPDAERLGLTDSSFSVSAWIKGNAFASTGNAILGTDRTGINNKGLYLAVHDSKPYMGFWNNDLTTSFTLSTNRWYHVVFRYDGDKRQQAIFVDGDLKNSRSNAAPFQGTDTVYLGRARSGRYFNGWIDDVRVFKRALTTEEIHTLYTKPVLKLQFEEASRPADPWSPFFFADTSGFSSPVFCTGNVQCPPATSGVQGNAADFGGDDHLAVQSQPVLNLGEGLFTMSAWVYPRNQDNDQVQGILGHYTGYYDTAYDRTNYSDKTSYPTLLRVGRKLRFGFGDGSKWYARTTSSDVLSFNTWNHVVLTFGPTYDNNGSFVANTAAIYVNGTRTDNWAFASATPYSSRQDFYIGRAGTRGTVYLDDFYCEEEADGGASDAEIYGRWNGESICTSDTETVGNPSYCRWPSVDKEDWVNIAQTKYWDVEGTLEMWEDDSVGPHTYHAEDDKLLETQFHMNDLSAHYRTLYGDGGYGEKDTRIDLYLGTSSNWGFFNPSIPFRGKIDEVTIYKRPLNEDEVQELYLSASTTLHLRLDDPPGSESLDNAVDLSRQSNAYCSGSTCPTTGVSGRLNQAALFDGTDDALLTPIVLDQSSGTTGATMMAWVYPTSASSGYHQVISTDNNGWDWSLARNGGTWWFFDGQSGVDTGVSADVNQWQHIAVVFAPGTGIRFYKFGTLRTTSSALGYDSSTGPIVIGRRSGAESQYFDGRIDDVRVFSRPLSEADVFALYRAAPIFQLHLDEAGGATTFADAAQSADGTCAASRLCAPVLFQNLTCHAQNDGTFGGSGEFYVNLDEERVWRGEDIVARAAPYPINISSSFCDAGIIDVYEDDVTGDDHLGSYTIYSSNAGTASHRFASGGDDVTLSWTIGTADVISSTCPKTGVAGQVGLGLEFEGQGNHISVPASSSTDAEHFTVGAWVMPTAVNANKWQTIVSRSSPDGGDRNYGLFISPGGMTATVSFEASCGTGSYSNASSQAPLIMNAWNHVMGTYDGETLSVYVNGYEQGSTSTTSVPCQVRRPIWIGGGLTASHIAPFTGRLDEIAVYDYALSARQVRDTFLYQGKLVEERQSHRIVIDNDAPSSSLRSFTSTQPYMPNVGRELHIEAHDPTSSVALVELGVNGDYARTTVPLCADANRDTAWCPFFEPSGEGRYRLTTRATDQVGNRETPSGNSDLFVDGTAPTIATTIQSGTVINAVPHPTEQNAWVVTLHGTVSDPTLPGDYAGSGVQTDGVRVTLLTPGGMAASQGLQLASVDGNTWQVDYVLDEAQPTGAYTIHVQAKDNVGNERTADLATIQVDATAPGAELDARGFPTTVVTTTLPLRGLVSEQPLLAGAVLRLHMEEDAGATQFYDSSGLDHHGTCAGGTCPTAALAGAYGRALRFDAAQHDWVESADFDLEDDFTLSLWLNPSTTNDGQAFVAKHTANGADLLLVGFYGGGYRVALRSQVYQAGTKTTGWQHLAVVGQKSGDSATQISVYKNGNLLWQHTLSAVVGDLAGKPWAIGQEWDGQSQSDFYGGMIDELVILNRALSADEVRAMAQPSSAGVQDVEFAFASELAGSVFYNELPPAGQVLYLPFEDNRAETGDLRFLDLSGWGGHGTCTGDSCPLVGQPGHSGSAVAFDGVADFFTVGGAQHLVMDEQVSLSAWIYPTGATTASRGYIVHKVNQYTLARNPNGTISWAFHNDDPGWSWVNTGYVAPPMQWTHIAVTYDAGEITTYANGESVHTYHGSGSIRATAHLGFRIGGNGVGSANFAGKVDDLRVLNLALSGDQVRDLYLGAGPVLALTFDQAWATDGSRIADLSGWENDGTLVGPAGVASNHAVPGIVGSRALELHPGQAVQVPDAPSLDLDQFSAGGWVQFNSTAGWQWLVRKAGTESGNTNYAIGIRPSSHVVEVQLGSATCAGSNPTAYQVTLANWTGWNHLMMTYDGAELRLYVNGELATSHSGLTVPACHNDGAMVISNLNGVVDDVRIYPRALSALEVQALVRSAWQTAQLAQSGSGIDLTTWSAQVPANLEGAYRLDLRGWDVGDHPDDANPTKRVWSGNVDTLAPRVSLSSQVTGDRIHYVAVAQDFNLTEAGFSSPCGAGAIQQREFFQSPWYLAISGQTPDSVQKLYQLTAECEFDTFALQPGEVGAYNTSGTALGIAVASAPWAGTGRTFALVADGFSGVQVIDVSNPPTPTLVATYDTPGWANGIAVSGTYAYVADGSPGMQVIDLAHPGSPRAGLAMPGVARGIALLGSYAYVVDGLAGLRVVDVSDPGAPHEVGALDTPGYARDIAIADLPVRLRADAVGGADDAGTPDDAAEQPSHALAKSSAARPERDLAQADQPDLIVESIQVSTTTLEIRQPLVITVTVTNQGTIDTNSFDAGVYIDAMPQGGCQWLGWDSAFVGPLQAGASTVLTFTYPGFTRVGTHTIAAEADFWCLVPESDETNNILGPAVVTATAFYVISATPPANSLNVARSSVISAAVNLPVDASTVNTRTFAVRGQQTGRYAGVYGADPLQFDAANDFRPGEQIVVALSSGMLATDGQPLVPYTWQFHAAAVGGTGVLTDSGQRLGEQFTQRVALGDIDGDGDLDAMVNTTSTVWLNSGGAQGGTPGVFIDGAQNLASAGIYALALGDLDGDGDLDTFGGLGGYYTTDPNMVWLNEGGVFADSGQALGSEHTLDVALGDLDGDGDLDAFVGNYEQPNTVWWNDGSGVFTDSGQAMDMLPTERVLLGDLDGDGDLDALVANSYYMVQVWLNDGGLQEGTLGTFEIDYSQSLPSDVYDIALGDLDGDGDLDALLMRPGGCEAWLNESGVFANSGQVLGTDIAQSLALGDLDHDGDLDLLVGQGGEVERPNQIWLNSGAGIFSDSGQRLGSEGTADVALGDLDGDGDLDAFVGNTGSLGAPDTIWLNNVNAPIAGDDEYTVPENSGSNTLRVLDNDSDADGDALAVIALGTPGGGTAGTNGSIVSYMPTPGFTGQDVFTYTVGDPGGLTDTATITVTVSGVDDPPQAQDDTASTPEDTPVTIAVLGNDSEPDGQVFFVSSVGTPSLGTAALVVDQVVYTPTADLYGIDVFTYTISDGALTDTATITVTVLSVNDPPTLGPLSGLTLIEGAGSQVVEIAGIGSGAANENQVLAVTATSTNTAILLDPVVVYASPNPTGTLSLTPVPNAFGLVTVIVTVTDGLSETVSSFQVTVQQVNDPPTLDPLPDLAVDEDSGSQIVNLTGISAGAGENQTLAVTAVSTNTALIPDPTVVYVSPHPTGTLSLSPIADQFGQATIVVTITDGLSETVRSFQAVVNPINDPPTLNAPPDMFLYVGAGTQRVTLTGIGSGAGNEPQTLAVIARSSNTGLIPDPTVTYTSPNPTGELVFAPIAGEIGQATMVVTVTDGISETARTFQVSVASPTGPFVYLADGPEGLRVVDVSRPNAPAEISVVPGYAQAVAVSGIYAYVVGSDRLWVIDISDPLAPTQIGELPGYFEQVALSSDPAARVIYLAERQTGLRVVDVSDPRHPASVRVLTTGGYAYAAAPDTALASIVYVAAGGAGLKAINTDGIPARATACDTAGNCTTANAVTLHAADLDKGTAHIKMVPPTRRLQQSQTSPTGVSILGVPPLLANTDPISITGEAYAITSSLQALTVTHAWRPAVNHTPIYTDAWASGTLTQTLWSVDWAPPGDGEHVIQAWLVNSAGEVASDTVTVTVDTQPPAVGIDPDALTVGISSTHYHAPRTLDLGGWFTDTSGVEQVQVWIAGAGQSYAGAYPASIEGDRAMSPLSGTWRLPWYLTMDPLPDGSTYTVSVQAVDVVGHAARITETIAIDIVPPTPVELTVSTLGNVITPGITLRQAPAPLVLTWTENTDGSGPPDYLVDWTTVSTAANHVTTTVSALAPRMSQHVAGEGEKVSVQLGSQDRYGQQSWQTWGPLYVDGPCTPDYVLLADTDGVYRGWMDGGCALIGVDRRIDRHTSSGAALNAEQRLYATWNAEALRLAWTGANWDTHGDLFVYLDTQPGGTITAYVPYTATLGSGASLAQTTVYLPGVTPTSTVDAMAADYLVWTRDAKTAHLLRWDQATESWELEANLDPTQYRYQAALNDGQTDLYLPFEWIGLAGGGSLDLVAFASDDPGSLPEVGATTGVSVVQALNLWAVMPPANPANSPRVTAAFGNAAADQEFALNHRYHWDALGANICPNGSDGTLPTRYLDADVQVQISANPAGAAYSLVGDDLFWLWSQVLGSRPADVTSFFGFMSYDRPQVGDGQGIAYTLTYHNRGTDAALAVSADITARYALRLPDGGPSGDRQTLSLGDIGPGEEGIITFRGIVDRSRSAEPWAAVQVRIYDAEHDPSGQPLDWLWIDHQVDQGAPEFFGIDRPEYLIAAQNNTLHGYSFDSSGVPTISLEISAQSTGGPSVTLVCPDDTPRDGQWSCDWDTSAAADGETFQVLMSAGDAYGQIGRWSQGQPFVVDRMPPTVTLDVTATRVFSGSVLQNSSVALTGELFDNQALGGVRVCQDASCDRANVWLDVPSGTQGTPALGYDDIPALPVPLTAANACGGSGHPVEVTFVVSESLDISQVSLGLNIEHTHRDDLQVTLRSPAGTTVQVLHDDGVSGTEFQNYDLMLSDRAANTYDAWRNDDPAEPIYDREARPASPLRAFSGEDGQGTWTLAICDANPSADDGSYNHSRLLLTPRAEHTLSRSGKWSYRTPEAGTTGGATGWLDYVEQTFEVYGVDLVGNETPNPTLLTVIIDNVAPVVRIDQVETSVPMTPSVRVLSGTVQDGSVSPYTGNDQIESLIVYVQTPTGEIYGDRAAQANGAWHYDLAALFAGPHTLWVVACDVAGNTTRAGPFEIEVRAPRTIEIFAPIVMRDFVAGPDLVTQITVATENNVQIQVLNQGSEPVVDEFWVDVYVGPRTPPAAVNQTWPKLGTQGLVWGVTSGALPLMPGEVLTLGLDSPYFSPEHSHVIWPIGVDTVLYAQVDSANAETTYGAVLETHEITGDAYNNLASASADPAVRGAQVPSITERSTPLTGLPKRP